MTDMEDRLTDAVDLVSQETRARTLVALAVRQRDSPDDPALRFSELRERVGHDDPGNFNYHLSRLREGLVEQTDAGYRLSNVGQELTGTLLSGRVDPDAELDRSAVESRCVLCGGPATVSYSDGLLRVECDTGHEFRANVGPELVADRSLDDAVELALLAGRFDWRLAAEGLCPLCNGPTTVEPDRTADEAFPVVYVVSCSRCGMQVQITPGGCVLDHPAVVSLCYDHGLDVRRDAREVLTEHVPDPSVLEEDPLRVLVEVSVDGEGVALELDEGGSVVSVTD